MTWPLTVCDDEFRQAASTIQKYDLPFKCHTSVKNLGTGNTTLLLLDPIIGIVAKTLLSSGMDCKPPDHPTFRKAHAIFYHDNLQMYLSYP